MSSLAFGSSTLIRLIRVPRSRHIAASWLSRRTVSRAVLIAVAFLSVAGRAGADMQIASNSPHATDLQRLYADISDAWKTGQPLFVQEVSPVEMRRWVDEHS